VSRFIDQSNLFARLFLGSLGFYLIK